MRTVNTKLSDRSMAASWSPTPVYTGSEAVGLYTQAGL